MRFGIVSAAALAVLSGCGGLGRPSDKQVLVATCLERGEAEATCDCIVGALENNLDPKLFSQVAQAVGREKQDMQDYLNSLSKEDLLAFSAITNDLEACGEAAPTGG